MITLKEVAELIASIGVLLTGIANIKIATNKKKKPSRKKTLKNK